MVIQIPSFSLLDDDEGAGENGEVENCARPAAWQWSRMASTLLAWKGFGLTRYGTEITGGVYDGGKGHLEPVGWGRRRNNSSTSK